MEVNQDDEYFGRLCPVLPMVHTVWVLAKTALHREIFWETHENFSETAPNQWCTSGAPCHSF